MLCRDRYAQVLVHRNGPSRGRIDHQHTAAAERLTSTGSDQPAADNGLDGIGFLDLQVDAVRAAGVEGARRNTYSGSAWGHQDRILRGIDRKQSRWQLIAIGEAVGSLGSVAGEKG